MKNILILAFYVLLGLPTAYATDIQEKIANRRHNHSLDTLPNVLADQQSDLLGTSLKNQAMVKFATHLLPDNLEEWGQKREEIRNKIILKSGLKRYPNLPLDMKETGSIELDGYTVKNIYFQTLPGVYATANLYIPNGKGPFPAVVSMHGHWREGKIAESVQSLGHSMAKNGYVSLVIDAFGAGERTTIHGDFEYHGANLGASLMNIGESLLGVQVADNMRAVDLLISLPYVDAENIGATGASGGGNQTMWFAALDERVKATMPIVSVGTFESAVMGSNCVCELLPSGLSFTESAGVLALYAPRALKMCNHAQDSNPTFFPAEMRRTFYNVKPIFKLHGVEEKVANEVFDLTHGYWKEDREAMLGWFDLHLKGIGNGESRPEKPFELLPMEDLLVFPIGARSPLVISTDTYSRNQGKLLRNEFLKKRSLDPKQVESGLKELLGINSYLEMSTSYDFSKKDGWERVAIQTSDGTLIPLLHVAPKNSNAGYTLVAFANGKNEIPATILESLKASGEGIVIVELSGTGEAASNVDAAGSSLSQFHTLSRAQLWLGKTMMGEWVRELELVSRYIQQAYKPTSLKFEGNKEAGLAALFLGALEKDMLQKLTLRNAPVSYLFDNRAQIDYFSMGIHLPGFLNWGDVSLAAALSTKEISFIDPVSMSGVPVSGTSLSAVKAEFDQVKKKVNRSGSISFQESKR